jgi:uncharacterized membrane protein
LAKGKTDWAPIAAVACGIVFAITIILFVAGYSGTISADLKPMDMTAALDSSGTITFTFTGWSEIIVAVLSGIGLAVGTYKKMTN